MLLLNPNPHVNDRSVPDLRWLGYFCDQDKMFHKDGVSQFYNTHCITCGTRVIDVNYRVFILPTPKTSIEALQMIAEIAKEIISNAQGIAFDQHKILLICEYMLKVKIECNCYMCRHNMYPIQMQYVE
jgi:hypothetical protein